MDEHAGHPEAYEDSESITEYKWNWLGWANGLVFFGFVAAGAFTGEDRGFGMMLGALAGGLMAGVFCGPLAVLLNIRRHVEAIREDHEAERE
ncbi:hypothetical protein [Candidatus Palauibacter sp.]|uniref:hypothetical protein n=1 Tax=Candidatus Palauibacter sp. TaxID=3101350 RepID=UPI003AF25DA7